MSTELRGPSQALAYRRVRICPSCHALFGKCGQPSLQRCRCERSRSDQTWPGFDFNTAVELCRCCGTELLRSGSRWSVWFCRECNERVGHLNGQHGRCVVPIGRHSLHAGYMLDAEDATRPVEVVLFADGLNDIVEAMRAVQEWAGIVVARNLDDLGVDAGSDGIGLITYLARLQIFQLSKEQRFREMVRFLSDVSGTESA